MTLAGIFFLEAFSIPPTCQVLSNISIFDWFSPSFSKFELSASGGGGGGGRRGGRGGKGGEEVDVLIQKKKYIRRCKLFRMIE